MTEKFNFSNKISTSLRANTNAFSTNTTNGMKKASTVELEIPNTSCLDQNKKKEIGNLWNDVIDMAPNEEKLGLIDEEEVGVTAASTPVDHSQVMKRTLMDYDLLLCTPVQRIDETVNQRVDFDIPNQREDEKPVSQSDDQKIDSFTDDSLQKRKVKLSEKRGTTAKRLLIKQPENEREKKSSVVKDISQIEGPSLINTFGFKVESQNVNVAKIVHEYQYLTVLSLELHTSARADQKPDPEFDAIRAIFYCCHNDTPPNHHFESNRHDVGMIVVDAHQSLLQKTAISCLNVKFVHTEDGLLSAIVDLVQRLDADVLVGYEIQRSSWGYLLQRAAQLNIDLCSQLSRLPGGSNENHFSADKDEYGADHMSEIHVAGRIVLNLWRIIRHEVTLNIYSYENVSYHVLHQRSPLYSYRTLSDWFDHKSHLYRWRTVEYFVTRVRGNLQLIEKLDLIGQTSEFARVFGIEFYDVLNRGSQFRVESMMLRIAKPLNFIAVSPSVQQRARMRAPECIPLNLEPKSEFYTHPVIVLDFQSLYPSIMIAYNYCFSTCLGRIEHLKKSKVCLLMMLIFVQMELFL